jgi:DivIVA domain-containing protein
MDAMPDRSITEATPEFATKFRGYHRGQVDDFVDAARERYGNATARIKAAEVEAARWRDEALQMGQRIAQLEQEASTTPPRSFAAFQERMADILGRAEETTAAMIAEAETESREVVVSATERAQASANETAGRLIAQARQILEGADAQRKQLFEVLAAERSQREELLGGVGSAVAGLTQLLNAVINLRDSLQHSTGKLTAAAPQPALSEPAHALMGGEAADLSPPTPSPAGSEVPDDTHGDGSRPH